MYGVGPSASDKIPSISGRGTRQSAQAPSPATTRTSTVPGEQETLVEVERLVTLTVVRPADPLCVLSPP